MISYSQGKSPAAKAEASKTSFLSQPTRPFIIESETPVHETTLAPVQKKENTTGLPDNVLHKMENNFKTDFSNVTVHPNSNTAKSLDAAAFTRSNNQGHEIHFAPGQFSPYSSKGRHILGHELGHVIQQRKGIVRPTTTINGLPVNDDPALEKAADRMGGVI